MSGYSAEITSTFSCPLKTFTFTRRRCLHFVAKGQGKIDVIPTPSILFQFIFKPKSHICQILFQDSLKGISHIAKNIKKTRFLPQNEPKRMKKIDRLRFSCMSLMIQNCTFLKILIGKPSRVFRMCQETNKKTHFLTKNEQKQAHLAAGGGL